MDKDCIFCKIANKEIPANILYENEEFMCFLDASPNTVGHCLIIPKEHYRNIYDIPQDVLSRLAILSKKIALKLRDVTGCDGMNIFQNNELAGAQSVFHYHLHLRPRYTNDEINKMKRVFPVVKLTEDEIDEIKKGFTDFTED